MIAYIRFACVYRRFKDVDELMDEIQSITPPEDPNYAAQKK
jgi:transcriptional repressor NrdR